MISRRQAVIGSGAICLASLSAETAFGRDSAPTVEELLAKPVVLGASLSPDGRKVAVLREEHRDGKRSAYVLLFDTDRLEKPPGLVMIGDYDVSNIAWANDERLLVWVLLTKTAEGADAGFWRYGHFFKLTTRRVISVSLDGQHQVMLFANLPDALRLNFDLGIIIDEMPKDPRLILMQMWDKQEDRQALYQVDVYTGAATLIEQGEPRTDGWITQDGEPIIRLDSTSSTVSVLVRTPGEKEWRFYNKFRRNQLMKIEGFNVVATTSEPGVVLVSSVIEGENFRSIRRFDIKRADLGDVVFKTASDRDLDDCLQDRSGGLIAASFILDRQSYQFLDPDMTAHYRGLNAYFSNECNIVLSNITADRKRMIVHASGPRLPGSFWLYDRGAKKLEPIGQSRPGLTRGRLAGMEAINLKSRDGLSLTAYLSTPSTSVIGGKRPLVVMPHGGPEARDFVQFDPFVQALAAKGWMVLQVNFRGSDGYGRAFAKAGRRHWGDLMQNDVEDALAAVVARGGVDEEKLAICGISYGGYAALMGAVKTPDRYRAVISIAGDADLLEALAFSRRVDGSNSLTYTYWEAQLGELHADRQALIAASPARHAERIKAPVLLMHGEYDSIVSVEQSRLMRRALKSAGKSVEYVEAPKEGHPVWSDDLNLMMIKRSVEHIAKAFKV